MRIQNSLSTSTLTSVVGTVTSPVIDLRTASGFAITSNITVDTNAAGTFAASSLASNHVTITAHGYKTGLKGQLTTAGSLPTGLSLSTNYFIVVIDANTVSFASSLVNALAGTVITITGGSGNSTFTATALAGATMTYQWSNDQVTWISYQTATSITTATTVGINQDRMHYPYLQIAMTLTAGSLTCTHVINLDKDT